MNNELLKQALDALMFHRVAWENITPRYKPIASTDDAIAAIRAALAAPQPEPVAWRGKTRNGTVIWAQSESDTDYGYNWQPLYTAPPVPQPVQPADTGEHIAHSLGGFRGGFVSMHKRPPTDREIWNHAIRSWRDLNPIAQPAVREPLSMEQVFASNEIMAVNASLGLRMDQLMRIVAAIEAHHGITGDSK